jgi:hypothetical protein
MLATRRGALHLPQPDLRLLCLQRDQVQPPLARHLVAVDERLREMMKRVEEQDRDVRLRRTHEVREDHVLCLKARRDARRRTAGQRVLDRRSRSGHQTVGIGR